MSFGLPFVPSRYIRGLHVGLPSDGSLFVFVCLPHSCGSFGGLSMFGLPGFLGSFGCLILCGFPRGVGSFGFVSIVGLPRDLLSNGSDCSSLSNLGPPLLLGYYIGCLLYFVCEQACESNVQYIYIYIYIYMLVVPLQTTTL